MCGFAGFLTKSSFPQYPAQILASMGQAIEHRGPDHGGVWWHVDSGIALAHRRLAILDLSPAGEQPMLSHCGRFVIVYNGEIYNHLELRKELENDTASDGISWKGHSDTETLLAAISAWGVEITLRKCVGMFAFALWDQKLNKLILARDRLGEKPLYYGVHDNVLLFGSELKAIKVHPSFQSTIDRDALALYLRYNYIPVSHSIYKGIFKLPPASYLETSLNQGFEVQLHNYWSLSQIAETGQQNLFQGDEVEAEHELTRLLIQSIKGQMLADVPLGAFLSGGVDSSAVAALMQSQSKRPIKTFTIGFKERAYNEAEYAHAVAKHLGTEHTELYVSPEQAMNVIERLPHIYDEPFADSSQIPTWLVAKLARQHVKVGVSGEGGDEIFGGYNRYLFGCGAWRKLNRIPLPLRKLAANLITHITPEKWNAALSALEPVLPEKICFGNPGDKLHKLAGVLNAADGYALYKGLVTQWENSEQMVLDSGMMLSDLNELALWPKLDDFVHQMMVKDTLTYMPDDILAKVDRAAMNVSLETRLPFLDHRVIEFAWQLPQTFKIKNGEGKYILRKVLYQHIPSELIERPKMGFGIPLDSWLRKPLRDWAETLLNEKRLRDEGYFEAKPIRKKWEEHLSGKRNWQHQLWSILMFQAWLEHQ